MVRTRKAKPPSAGSSSSSSQCDQHQNIREGGISDAKAEDSESRHTNTETSGRVTLTTRYGSRFRDSREAAAFHVPLSGEENAGRPLRLLLLFRPEASRAS